MVEITKDEAKTIRERKPVAKIARTKNRFYMAENRSAMALLESIRNKGIMHNSGGGQ